MAAQTGKPQPSDGVLLSIALRMPKNTSEGFFGHEVRYQQALIEAARRMGVTAAVLSPVPTDAEFPGFISIAVSGRRGDWTLGLEAQLAKHRGRRVTVLFYEGDLATLRYVYALAVRHPEVSFAVNLFGSDSALQFPQLSERSLAHGRYLDQEALKDEAKDLDGLGHDDLPPNVLVYADSARRTILARSLGFDTVKTWPLYSVVQAKAPTQSERSKTTTRIVVPVAGWQATRQLIYEVACVVELCARYSPEGQDFEWLVFGGGYDGPRRRSLARRMSRLKGFGVAFLAEGLSGDLYARTLADADFVWLPKRGHYTTRSSGKAADALVMGAPLLAPNGSFPAQEMERWVPGAPAYSGAREAVEILLRARLLAPHLREALIERIDDIRWWYSPDRAARELWEASQQLLEDPRRADDAPGRVEGIGHSSPPLLQRSSRRDSIVRVSRAVRRRVRHLMADVLEAWIRLRVLIRVR